MHLQDWILLTLFIAFLIIFGKIIGGYLCKVLDPKEKTFLDFILKPLEKVSYKLCKIDSSKEMEWKEYLISILVFSGISFLVIFGLIYFQKYLPLNPQNLSSPSPHLTFNIATSFLTNTNWQSYAGESTLSSFTQMAALAVQNFTSASVGLAAAAALIRGLINKNEKSKTLGNFWVDIVRINYYLLLPLALCFALIFISQGTPQNFSSKVEITTLLDKSIESKQTIIEGPIASQESIKLIGTNGGGYTGANSAHPYENPTPISNFFQMVAITLLPVSQIFYFGKKIGNKSHSNWIFAGLVILFIVGCFFCSHFEYKSVGLEKSLNSENMQGKEERFGIFSSTLFTNISTAIACGAVNSSLDSYTPLGGMVPLLNMDFGEVIFGGVGSGLYTIILYVILAVFISGLIIGRTPEYLGKKIEPKDMKLVMIAFLCFIFVIALFSFMTLASDVALTYLSNDGPHGITEILYAFSSCTANNGSAFGGLHSNNVFFNITLGCAMLLGRYIAMGALVALGGFFAAKKVHPLSKYSFPMTGFMFLTLFVGVIVLFGTLTFLPLLVFGPILDYLLISSKFLLGAILI